MSSRGLSFACEGSYIININPPRRYAVRLDGGDFISHLWLDMILVILVILHLLFILLVRQFRS